MFFLLGVILFLALAAGGWFYYACTVPTSQFFAPVLVRGAVGSRRIALTFDDGPASPFTEKILDILRDQRIPATFFVCGKNVERHPEIVKRIVQEGHTLGNHTYSHPFLYFKSRKRIAEEIDRTQEAIKLAAGVEPTLFRPPYGGRWLGLMGVLRQRGMKLIMWSATGYDWKMPAAEIVRCALSEISWGAVLLLHDGHNVNSPRLIDRSATVAALPTIIEQARNAGFDFVPVTDFFGGSE